MFHIFTGDLQHIDDAVYIQNELFGIQVVYIGEQKNGTFFLHPQIDQSHNTIKYYAFEDPKQKKRFLQMMKIQGVGGKSAYHIAMLPVDELAEAIDTMDIKYFQKLPGIGPKTAKRLVVELKQHVTQADLGQIDIDEKLYKDIISSLKALGYESKRVKKLLPDCPFVLEEKKLPEIMKRLINNL